MRAYLFEDVHKNFRASLRTFLQRERIGRCARLLRCLGGPVEAGLP